MSVASKRVREQFVQDAVDKMFSIAGEDVGYEDVIEENWNEDVPFWDYYTWSSDQKEEFKEWFVQGYLDRIDLDQDDAEITVDWFINTFGLINEDEVSG